MQSFKKYIFNIAYMHLNAMQCVVTKLQHHAPRKIKQHIIIKKYTSALFKYPTNFNYCYISMISNRTNNFHIINKKIKTINKIVALKKQTKEVTIVSRKSHALAKWLTATSMLLSFCFNNKYLKAVPL